MRAAVLLTDSERSANTEESPGRPRRNRVVSLIGQNNRGGLGDNLAQAGENLEEFLIPKRQVEENGVEAFAIDPVECIVDHEHPPGQDFALYMPN